MKLVQLKEVVSIERDQRLWKGRRYIGLENIETATGRIVGEAPVADVKSTTFGFTADHVLYGRLRPYLNKVLLPDFEGHCSTEIFPLRPDLSLDRRYLWYWLSSGDVIAAINATCTGARMPRANMDRVLELAIPLPSLDEQLRIVAVLNEAFTAIATATANAEKNLANARELLEVSLEEYLSGDGPNWRRCPLSEVVDISHGYAFKGPDFENSDDETKPIVLTPGNYTENSEIVFSRGKTKRLLMGGAPRGFEFNIGDLTVVMTDLSSNMKILGRPAFVEAHNVLHNQRIGRVMFRSSEIEPRLVYYIMQRPSSLKRIRDTATGTMVRHTAPKRMLANVISFPRERRDQLMLIARLDAIRADALALRTTQFRRLDALSRLKASLLARAFSGELAASTSEPLPA